MIVERSGEIVEAEDEGMGGGAVDPAGGEGARDGAGRGRHGDEAAALELALLEWPVAAVLLRWGAALADLGGEG